MKKILAILMVIAMTLSMLISCGPESDQASSDPSEIVIWYTGGADEAEKAKALEAAFAASQEGEENPITITFVLKSGYSDILASYGRGVKLPDITEIDDEYFKRMVVGDEVESYIAPLDDLLENSTIDIDSFWPEAVSRYRYNAENNTSNDTDSLYCIPKDINPTILFYNEAQFKEVGITVISVNEEDLEAFYAGTKADNRGKYITDYPAIASLKGDYYPMYQRGFWAESFGENQVPSGTMVFNNCVAMNWEEVGWLGRLLTKTYNSNSPSTYGYYTEWWFNYGWSVGGDCIGDTTGDGDYVFTLNDSNPNYKVLKDCTINGHSYKASTEDSINFVSYADKVYLAANQSVVTELGDKVQEFPSTLEAFGEFTMLTREYGYTETYEGITFNGIGVTPLCQNVTTYEKALSNFNGSELAMFVGYADCSYDIKSSIEWDFAPVPMYKEYDENDNLVKVGDASSQSKTVGYAISSSSTKKEAAMKVLEWLSTEGQKILAEDGFSISNGYDMAVAEFLPEVDSNKNWACVLTAAKTQKAGDWWYMTDRDWIANWSEPLNQNKPSVRNNTLTLAQYFEKTVDKTNNYLPLYK